MEGVIRIQKKIVGVTLPVIFIITQAIYVKQHEVTLLGAGLNGFQFNKGHFI